MTLAHLVPALAQFKDFADASRERALRTVDELAVLGLWFSTWSTRLAKFGLGSGP